MLNVWIVARRELAAYFTSPLAYVFIVIFLALAGGLTFFFGQWLERGQADLQVFFIYHPYLYLFLIPAVGMRLWAEEDKQGTMEILLTLPARPHELVAGKFLASWALLGVGLLRRAMHLDVHINSPPQTYPRAWASPPPQTAWSTCAPRANPRLPEHFSIRVATLWKPARRSRRGGRPR